VRHQCATITIAMGPPPGAIVIGSPSRSVPVMVGIGCPTAASVAALASSAGSVSPLTRTGVVAGSDSPPPPRPPSATARMASSTTTPTMARPMRRGVRDDRVSTFVRRGMPRDR
jgi:hypothetical protein